MGYNIFRSIFKSKQAELADEKPPEVEVQLNNSIVSLEIEILADYEIDVSLDYGEMNPEQAMATGDLLAAMDAGEFGLNCLKALLKRAQENEDDDLLSFLIRVTTHYQKNSTEKPIVSPTEVFKQ